MRRKLDLAPPRPRHGTIRVALIGASNIARWAHLPALRRLRGVSLHAVCSASPVRGMTYGQRNGAAYVCTDYDQILQDPDVDAVLITTRNQLHASQAVAALRAGKHVFVEKPMAISEAECRLVHEAARESGRHLAVGFNRRFAPDYITLASALATRTSPAVLSARVNSPGIAGGYWMADPAIGGAILGEATHFADLFYWLLRSEPAVVSAYSLPTHQKDPVGLNNLVASFRFEDGSVASLVYCTTGHAQSGGGERVEVFAPGIGAFTEDFRRVGLHGPRGGRRPRLFAAKGYGAQLTSFFATIRGEAEPQVTVLDGIRSTMMCLNILEAAATGEPRTVNWQAALRTG
jgi:predicted dehydrogenase